MSSFGRVIGGVYLDSGVTTATFGSDLVVQTGIRGRKLTADTVESWQETPIEVKDSAFTAMGKAAAGVALPGRFGKAASAAVGAAFDSKKPDHHVRINWADGKQSLLKLPDALFTHLEMVLPGRHIPNADPVGPPQADTEMVQPTIVDRTFDLVSGLVKDRFPSRGNMAHEIAATPVAQADVAEQLQKLASLRDAGILTDEEFVTKKTELLARL
ncbi:Short C-terminal domain-containing protein [Agreia bicolorata]|uniref:Short C-terminal domain-containing protein n=1 Tax=Agreia bicolorata TaxID=110935 RepID=A0A1T4Y2H4_9MICO|nr:SHOCT domain-containing protein [Agreia bicolorata]SKA95823.1 Short C-terminal domain-containing protein [Agreia bicolorata]